MERNVSAVLKVLISSQSCSDILKYAEDGARQSFDAVTAHREAEERFDDINGTTEQRPGQFMNSLSFLRPFQSRGSLNVRATIQAPLSQ